MKWVVLLVMHAVFCSAAHAQLSVQLRADKDVFLLYESIPLSISLRNNTGRNVELLGGDADGWLDFIVTDEAGRMMKGHGGVRTEGNVLIPATQTLNRKIDVLPLYNIRQRGTYRVQARVRQGALHALSAPVTVVVVQGREIWKQTIPLPVTEKRDEYRTYALLTHRTMREDVLHVSVQDEPNDLIYGLIPLGGLIPFSEPDVRIDKHGHLHLLYKGAPYAYSYVHIDPQAQVIERATYSDKISRPRLAVNTGMVSVLGGTQTHPRPERIMTDAELNPPPLPPPAPPKKKWWWPFRPKAPTAEE